MKKRIIIVIIVLIIAVVAVRVGIAIFKMMKAPAGQEVKAVPVEVAEVSLGDVENSLFISGMVQSTNQVEVVSKIPGKIVSIPVSIGSYVWAGSTIAVIDRDEPGLGFKNYVAESPISGYVAMIMQDVGDYVSRGMPIAMVVKMGSTKIVCNVTEKDLPYLQKGGEVRIRINDETISGKVTRVSGVIDTYTYSSEVEIKPMEGESKVNLIPGTFVDIEVSLQVHKDVLTVPKEALVHKKGTINVYVVVNDKVKLTPVEVGLREKDIVEVKDGLTLGDKIVVVGVGDVEDGSEVKVIAEGS